VNKWDKRWSDMAELVASWSEDRSTKVGAVIVDSRNNLISIGWNGFPRGIKDLGKRHERPMKYAVTEHAERNAIFNVSAKGDSTMGCSMYCLWFPCCDCARAIIQSGIKKLFCERPDFDHERWGNQFVTSHEMLEESGVEVIFYDRENL
jgi:dCMP deaminase